MESSAASDRLLELAGWQALSVLGDSHARIFARIRDQRLVPRTRFDLLVVSAATARGLANPNSTTNALELFEALLARVPRTRRTLVMLGEVDCGYLAWYLAAQRGTSIEVELAVSIERQCAFLDGLLAEGRTRVGVVSAPAPTVEDYATWAGMDNHRRSVTATMVERTRSTVDYNTALRAWTDRHGCVFVDLDEATIDPTTGVVRPEFRNPDPFDHHLSPGPLAELIAEKLNRLDWS